jgi:hypothetical protein
VEGVEAGNAEGFDKKLLAAPEERDGVWRMKARVNVRED